MSNGADSEVDSELAALLDEELFQEADTTAPDAAAAAEGPEQHQHQQNKRARLEEAAEASQEGPDQSDDDDVDEEDDEQQQASAAAGFVCPPHPGWWNDLCIRCGALRPSSTLQGTGQRANGPAASAAAGAAAPVTKIRHLHHKAALEVSAHEAARIASGGLQRLIAQKRLVLVLDLDHTLLNTVRDIDLVGPEREAAIKQLEQQHQALQQQQQAGQPGNSSGTSAGSQQQQQGQEGSPQQLAEAPQPDMEQPAPATPDGTPDAGQQGEQQEQQEQPAAAVPGSNGNGSNAQRVGPRAQLYYFRDKGLWTKLRPGVGAFLSAVCQLYELHIYTMGDKGYAGLMADTLDPEHKLFVGRVISAADSTRAGMKDLDVLLADDSLVLILDDTEHVWEKHRANLIQVERYHYFGASARLFHPEALSPLQQGTDEPEQGGMLDNAARLLARIHERVYGASDAEAAAAQQQQEELRQQQQQQQQQQQEEQQEGNSTQQLEQQQQPAAAGIRRVKRCIRPGGQQPFAGGGAAASGGLPAHNDVRECLDAERKTVLAGCCIAFSRCWPQQQVPESHPLWLLAERLGASCSLSLQPGTTTHLIVAADPDHPGNVPFTDKVQAAHKAGIPVVHPDWLLACRFAWKQLPAAAFSLKTYSSVPGSSCCSRRWLGLARGGAGAAASAAERAAVAKGAGRTGP